MLPPDFVALPEILYLITSSTGVGCSHAPILPNDDPGIVHSGMAYLDAGAPLGAFRHPTSLMSCFFLSTTDVLDQGKVTNDGRTLLGIGS
jgi:hypothetical protein